MIASALSIESIKFPGSDLDDGVAQGWAGIKDLVDAAPAVSLPEEVWRQVYLVRTNAREASLLTGVEVHDAGTAREAAKLFFERGVQVVSIQAAAQENILMWHGDEISFLSSRSRRWTKRERGIRSLPRWLWRFLKDSHGQRPVGSRMQRQRSQRHASAPNPACRGVKRSSHYYMNFARRTPSFNLPHLFHLSQAFAQACQFR
jgi:hypothetical protein